MVWVCPPHTSMNLYSRPGSHRLVILADSARAFSASRNSSTNFMATPSDDLRVAQRGDLVVVGLPDAFQEVHGGLRLRFVYFGQCEPDVDQHPVTRLDALLGDEPDVDRALHAADIHPRQIRAVRKDLDHLTGDTEAHGTHLILSASRRA